MGPEFIISDGNDVAILDCCNDSYNDIFSITKKSKIRYAIKHKMDFIRYRFKIKGRTAHWGRVLGIERCLPNYDRILYLDTDTIILDHSFDIRNIFTEKNIITGPLPHEGHIGTNGMIFRNKEWTYDFLKIWFNQKKFINKPYYGTLSCGLHDKGGLYFEQSAFHYLYDHSPDVRDNTDLVAQKYMHSRPDTHAPEDFLIHVPGYKHHKKVALLKQFSLKQISLL